MSSLRRTGAGCYGIDQAVTMADLLAMADPESRLLPVDSLFAHLPAHTVGEKQLKAVYNGAAVKASQLPDGSYRVYAPDGSFLLLGEAKSGMLRTIKSFFEVK